MNQNQHTDYHRPDGSGVVQGDSKAMPMKDSGSMAPETYGADLGSDATNRIGSIRSTSKSDPMDPA
jgi:hypothetical protein